MLMLRHSCALPFCFLLFVAQLAPSLPFSFAAPSRRGTARFRQPILPTARTFFFVLFESLWEFKVENFIFLLPEGFWLTFGKGGGAG